MTTNTDAVLPDAKQSTLDLARDFAIVYDDGTIEFDEDSLVRFVDVLRVEIARELYVVPTAEQAEAVRVLSADDADMVWPQDDGEVMHHSLDDAVEYEISQAWPVEAPLEFKFQVAKRIPDVTIRVTEITESGHEWEIVTAAPASSAGDQA